jgi:hypothetical protein
MLSLGIQAFSQSEEVNLRIKQVENNLITYSTESEPPIPTQSEPLSFRFLE